MITFIPGQYYFVRPIRGGGTVPIKATEPVRYIKDGNVGRGIHALTGRTLAVYPENVVKQTDRKEIASVTGRAINLVI